MIVVFDYIWIKEPPMPAQLVIYFGTTMDTLSKNHNAFKWNHIHV